MNDIPDEVRAEATLADAWRAVRESVMDLEKSINHYGHEVDVTELPYYCSSCEMYLDVSVA